MNSQAGCVLVFVLCVTVVLGAGCLDGNELSTETESGVNLTEAAIAVALNDTIVKENIPVGTGEYEIVDVGTTYFEQTGQEGVFSGTFTKVTFRCCNKSSLYHVIIDGRNGTVINRDWQFVKKPMPCSGSEPPDEFFTLEEASTSASSRCALAVPVSLPSGYGFSMVSIFGEPCPRIHVVYANRSNVLLLVQTCAGDPPYAFAITGTGVRNVTVKGNPARYEEGIGQNQVSWTDENRSYWLVGNLNADDLLSVASSVRPFARPVIATVIPTLETGDYIPGISHFGTPDTYWPDEIVVKQGVRNTGEIVIESRAKGYGMVHLRILSRVTEPISAGRDLSLPEGMTISIKPTDFMAYPNETHYAEITVDTTTATPPREYVFRFNEEFEGSFLGGGWFVVEVME